VGVEKVVRRKEKSKTRHQSIGTGKKGVLGANAKRGPWGWRLSPRGGRDYAPINRSK